MSYYEKYLKYKNKYIQYKNKLEIEMQGGSKSNKNNTDILYINNLTATPSLNKNAKQNKSLSINMLTATPRLSEIAGGAYKSNNKQDKLLKLLVSDIHSDINTTTNHSESPIGNIKTIHDLKDKSFIKDPKYPYFAKDVSMSSSSTSSDNSSDELF
jgi:hypothetical protein